jgi:hypothetical protein
MAYPEPTLILKGKAAREFLVRLANFKLTSEQKKFYKDARKEYRRSVGKDRTIYC